MTVVGEVAGVVGVVGHKFATYSYPVHVGS
jgi:hypothetical protein